MLGKGRFLIIGKSFNKCFHHHRVGRWWCWSFGKKTGAIGISMPFIDRQRAHAGHFSPQPNSFPRSFVKRVLFSLSLLGTGISGSYFFLFCKQKLRDKREIRWSAGKSLHRLSSLHVRCLLVRNIDSNTGGDVKKKLDYYKKKGKKVIYKNGIPKPEKCFISSSALIFKATLTFVLPLIFPNQTPKQQLQQLPEDMCTQHLTSSNGK